MKRAYQVTEIPQRKILVPIIESAIAPVIIGKKEIKVPKKEELHQP